MIGKTLVHQFKHCHVRLIQKVYYIALSPVTFSPSEQVKVNTPIRRLSCVPLNKKIPNPPLNTQFNHWPTIFLEMMVHVKNNGIISYYISKGLDS